MAHDKLIVAGKAYGSRLLVGTGKYRDFEETRRAIEASGAEIVTVAIRRTNIGQNAGEPSLLDVLPPSSYTILPNTAGCYTAQDAVRTLRLARELLDALELAGRRLAVERNGEIVPRSNFGEARLNDGDRIEAVMAVEIGRASCRERV